MLPFSLMKPWFRVSSLNGKRVENEQDSIIARPKVFSSPLIGESKKLDDVETFGGSTILKPGEAAGTLKKAVEPATKANVHLTISQPSTSNTITTMSSHREPYHREYTVPFQQLKEPYNIGIATKIGLREKDEDRYAYILDFAHIRGQGYFAIFDGHGGKEASEYCKEKFHNNLTTMLRAAPALDVDEALKQTFLATDIGFITEKKNSNVGSTAAVAFVRIEDDLSNQNFSDQSYSDGPLPEPEEGEQPIIPPLNSKFKRILYTSNAGDARVVLCRGGVAMRLTYDHKASDASEKQRVVGLGGRFFNGLVWGGLAVTRSIGDWNLKKYVTSEPYTLRTELGSSDEFFIIASDGLWDVISDQEAVEHIREFQDSTEAANKLIQLATERRSWDDVTVMVVRLSKK